MTQPDSASATFPSTRPLARIASRLDQQLLSYASAAAGVGLLAVSQGADAKVVYTAANVSIPTNAFTNLDLNNDGIPDFAFYFYAYGPRKALKPLGYHEEGLSLDPLKAANEIWGVTDSKGLVCAAALPRGVPVGPGALFRAVQLPVWGSGGTAYSGPFYECPLAQKTRGAFLGLKFVINGQTHYGWAHVTAFHRDITLQGYAYETVPNQTIQTGQTSGPVSDTRSSVTLPQSEPATLGLLAQGSRGLSIWRRPEESQDRLLNQA